METTPKTHLNQDSGRAIYGLRLTPGDKVEATDVYPSVCGNWEPCPLPGLVLPVNSAFIFVRPCKEKEETRP